MKYIAGEARWRRPDEFPPPSGTKMLLLTDYGIAMVGTWGSGLGLSMWAPLPKISNDDKRWMRERNWNRYKQTTEQTVGSEAPSAADVGVVDRSVDDGVVNVGGFCLSQHPRYSVYGAVKEDK